MVGCHEREVHDCSLKSCGVFYFSNMCLIKNSGERVDREHCSVYVAPGGYVWPWCLDSINKPGGGVMLIMVINISTVAHPRWLFRLFANGVSQTWLLNVTIVTLPREHDC